MAQAGTRCVRVESGCRPFAWLQAVDSMPMPVLLESAQAGGAMGRWSILCWDPTSVVTCREDATAVEDPRTGAVRHLGGDPFRVLAREFDRHRRPRPDGCRLPFVGGAAGYFSYDLKHHVECLPRLAERDLDVPEVVLGFYDRALVFDHADAITWWVGPAGAEPDLPEPGPGEPLAVAPVRLASNFTAEGYVEAVSRAREYIAAGDIFQVNLSQRFEGRCPSSGLAVYSRLRAVNPAPFAAYIRHEGFEIISSSPERFLLLEDDVVTTRPIKGTRPRIEGRAEFNARMESELRSSVKDHAELAMIVDLERNDLGRSCQYGTVRVREHACVEEYPTVFHLVSTVCGRLDRRRHDEFDLLKGAFPGGSITGAPKVRAMEIIEELEPHARSVYTGAVGYVSFHGRMDLSIAIRTMVRCGERVCLHAGGGIVADSDPVFEHMETLHKARALFRALNADNYDELMEADRYGRP